MLKIAIISFLVIIHALIIGYALTGTRTKQIALIELRIEGLIQAVNELHDYVEVAHHERENLRKLMELYGIQAFTK